MEQHLVASEEQVDLLQAELGRLGVEPPNERDKARIEDAEVDVGLVTDRFDRDRCDLDNQECELAEVSLDTTVNRLVKTTLTIQLEADARAAADARIGRGEYSDGSSQGIARRPTAKKKLTRSAFPTPRRNMRTSSLEQEEHGGCDDTSGVMADAGRTGEHSHAGTLANDGEEHELPLCARQLGRHASSVEYSHSSDAVKNPDGNQRGEEVGDTVEAWSQSEKLVARFAEPRWSYRTEGARYPD